MGSSEVNPTLSKSDFQLASSCPKKLVYKKALYPTTHDTNEYMEMLAQGGYIVGKMATLYYDDGIEIAGKTTDCLQRTEAYLQQENVVLFEAAIQVGQQIVRIDILEKKGNALHLIEVKAKSFDSTDKNMQEQLNKYKEDVAFQYRVLSEKYPKYSIRASLFMPDKSVRTTLDELAGWFSLEQGEKDNNDNEEIITQMSPRFTKPLVRFKYENEPNREQYIQQLRREGILTLLDVTEEVRALQPSIAQRTNTFLRILNTGIQDSDYRISKSCKSCEFNTPGKPQNGFGECWGALAYQDHHVFDLYYGGSIKGNSDASYLNELIEEGKTRLFDIDPKILSGNKKTIGQRASRQLLQLEKTRKNEEWISDELASFSASLKYPLHFIDFETYTGAIPFHQRLRPYELIAFQWSCHTIPYKGAAPTHQEWIHTGEKFPHPSDFPNFEFAHSLMQQVGSEGTPFMWATHENTVLRLILGQMSAIGHQNSVLEEWLTAITSDSTTKRAGRLVDMNQLALSSYFHPAMKGRTSIKKVLPAIWSNFPYLHQIPFFADYAPQDLASGIIDPYDTLKAMHAAGDESEEEAVSGGTDAMRAYYRIRFDNQLAAAQKDELRRQLLQYCRLDTLAMVIIAHHWGIK